MVTMTLAISVDLKQRMDSFPEMNWSEVARQAFTEKVNDLEFLKKFKSKSTMTEEDAVKLGRKVNTGLAKRFTGRQP